MAEVTTQMVKELRQKTGGGISLCKEALIECDGNFEEAEMFIRKKDKDKAAKRSERATGEGIIFCKTSDDGTVGTMVEIACETDFVAKNEKFIALGEDILGSVSDAGDFDNLNELKISTGKTIAEAMEEAVGVIGENMRFKGASRIKAPEGGRVYGYKHFNQKAASFAAVALDGVAADALDECGKDICMHITSFRPMGLVKEDISEDIIAKEKEVFKEEVQGKPEDIQEKILEGKLSKFFAGKCLSEQGFVKDESVKVKDHVSACAKAAGGTAEIKGFARFELGLDAVVVGAEVFINK
ncbi:MAG: translation elongation factor Ts [Planctomycetota bacterium]|jgi:elongation factor Ts